MEKGGWESGQSERVSYREGRKAEGSVSCPVAESILEDSAVFRLNEAMNDSSIEKVAGALGTVVTKCLR